MAMTRVGNLSYDPKKIIGRGSIGTVVFQGFHHTHSDDDNVTSVAVKRILKSGVSDNGDESSIEREVELMQRSSYHPNILRYICTEKNDDFLFIATELCQGTLEDYVKGTYQGPRFKNEREMLRQVTRGLAYLHNLGIVHRDIKPTNILIFVPSNGGTIIKPQIRMADFSLSKALNNGREDFTNTSVTNPAGTKGWMAPEVYINERFDFKVDMFALGCIFGYLLSKENVHPFGANSYARIARIIAREPMILIHEDLKAPYSEEDVAFKLIQSLLEMDHSLRPAVEEVVQNPFFSIDLVREQMMLVLCKSFRKSITDEAIGEFEKLTKDETLDVDIKTKKEETPLHLICKYYENDNLIDLMQLLIRRGASTNATTKRGETPLHLVCKYYGHDNLIDLMCLFIERGISVNATTRRGETPLHLICKYYESDHLIYLVRFLIQKGSSVHSKTEQEETPFHLLCQNYKNKNLIDIAKIFLEADADINAKMVDGRTPLYVLCQSFGNKYNRLELVQFFIDNGADPCAKTVDNGTLLHYLCGKLKHKSTKFDLRAFFQDMRMKKITLSVAPNIYKQGDLNNILQLLIQNGADVNSKTMHGKTPLHYLYKNYKLKGKLIHVARVLKRNGADVNAVSDIKNDMTPLHYLCRNHKLKEGLMIKLVQLLIQRGANVNSRVFLTGETPLHFLCKNYDKYNLIDVIKLLIKHGADINATMTNGYTPLHFLCINYGGNNLINIVQLLIENGAAANTMVTREVVETRELFFFPGPSSLFVPKGNTPLHSLCLLYTRPNLIDIVRLLVQNGADVNANQERLCFSSLHALCANYENNYRVDVARFLIQNGADVNAEAGLIGGCGFAVYTPLCLLCGTYKKGDPIAFIQILTENGADINAKTTLEGETPLHLLCANYENTENELMLIDIVRLLIEKGANIHARATDRAISGSTPLKILRRRYRHKISGGWKFPSL